MNASGPVALQLMQVRKSFGPVVALRSGSLTVHSGSIHALVGENGAGKSTLVKIVAGVYQRDGGELLLHGESVDFSSTAASKDAGIAVIYQEPTLFPDLSVTENIFMGRQPLGAGRRIDRKAMHDEALGLFKRLGVHLDPRRLAEGLSIADQQIIEIAKAISLDASVLIMDEPTAALSGVEVERLFAVARSLRDEGRALVFISHRFDEVFALCDTVTVMRDGEYISTDPIAETTSGQIVAKMVGREVGDLFPKTPAEIGEPVLKVSGLESAGHLPRRQLRGARRRDRRPGRTGRRRTQRDRAGDLRRRRLRLRHGRAQRQVRTPAQPPRRDPRRYGLRPGGPPPAGPGHRRLRRAQRRRGDPLAHRALGAPHDGPRDAYGRTVGGTPRGQDQRTRHARDDDERRQPAEGRHRQVARHEPVAADHRRADPRHRHRHQGRGAPPDLRARRSGPGDPHDLVGAARGARHGRPRPGRPRGPHHREPRPRGRDARERHDRRHQHDGSCRV